MKKKVKALFTMWLIVLLHAIALLSGPKDIYQYVILVMDTLLFIFVTVDVIKKSEEKGDDDEK